MKNLAPGVLLRNIIIFIDFLCFWLVVSLYSCHGQYAVHLPSELLILGTLSLVVAQLAFSTIIHQHHHAVEKVISQVTKLSFVFALTFFLLCFIYKLSVAEVAIWKAVGMVSLYTYIALAVTRLCEYYAIKIGRSHGRNSRMLLFVGKPDRILISLKNLDIAEYTGIKLYGYYANERSPELDNRLSYLGDLESFEEFIEKDVRVVDEIHCSFSARKVDLMNRTISYCLHNTVRFYYIPSFINAFGYYLQPQVMGEQVVFTNMTEPLTNPANRMIKRLFDIFFSGLAIICLLPFFPIVALIIKIQSPGPIFFKQVRTGYRGRDFNMYKFRSMHVNADADALQATKDDPRKYPFGNFMRKTSIDELPQLWNIFIGDMSIVGPRPHMIKQTKEYRVLIDDYMQRHYVRPGLTGWAQTTGFRGETSELWQMEGRVKKDIWYIQNWSFFLDLRIIFRTIKQVLKKDSQAY